MGGGLQEREGDGRSLEDELSQGSSPISRICRVRVTFLEVQSQCVYPLCFCFCSPLHLFSYGWCKQPTILLGYPLVAQMYLQVSQYLGLLTGLCSRSLISVTSVLILLLPQLPPFLEKGVNDMYLSYYVFLVLRFKQHASLRCCLEIPTISWANLHLMT
jgi:hypothetical protein